MYGAGDGNRTHDNSLEGCSFTTKLHPQYEIYFKSLIDFFIIQISTTFFKGFYKKIIESTYFTLDLKEG